MILEALGNALTGGLLGSAGHLVTHGIDVLAKNKAAAAADEASELKAEAAVKAASYKQDPRDWVHPLLAVLLLVATMVAGLRPEPDAELLNGLTLWTGMAMSWLFGVLQTRQ